MGIRTNDFIRFCGQLYNSGLIGGFCHLYIGQEAVAVGAYMAKKEQDSVITNRDHCHAILAGLNLNMC